MVYPSRVRMTGPLTPLTEGFAAELTKQGYRPGAAARQLHLIAHLSRWLTARDKSAEDLTPSVINNFCAARRAQGYAGWLSPRALNPFLGYLRTIGLTVADPVIGQTPAQRLLGNYHKYLLEIRGLADGSARGYIDLIRPFVLRTAADYDCDWAAIRASDITTFVHWACAGRSSASARLLTTALRSLLAYLYIEDWIDKPLAAVVPSAATPKLAGLPQPLEPGDVEQLLAACDRRTPKGRRDYAMLMLLGRLGLRAGEVSELRLDDLDWRAGTLSVHGKGTRIEQLPLPPAVGEALADYLRNSRPATAQGRTVFVRIHAPHGPVTSAAVTKVVEAAAARAGLPAVTAHRLRHTVATQMVRAGVPLAEVGQVLRHRRLVTTAIYAKVDREGLRCLARQWPGGAS